MDIFVPARMIAIAALCAAACSCGTARRASRATPPEKRIPGHPPAPVAGLSLKPGHPRLVFLPDRSAFPDARTFDSVRGLWRTDATFSNIFANALQVDIAKQDPAMLAACWIVTRDDKYAGAAIERMLSTSISRSGEQYYSTIWAHALAYDWLYGHSLFTADKRRQVEGMLAERLGTELGVLDGVGMALWHGRNQAANNAMIAALAVGDLPGQEPNLQRAAGHYLESLRALQYAEAWPEGASYWIYNRTGPYALAADCVMTATGAEAIGGIRIRDVMRTTGLWHIYQFGPNGVFEPFGDSHGSIRLGETGWWELTTDHFARLSRDPAVMAAADFIRNRSPKPYGKRPYYWCAAITYDPAMRPRDDYDPAAPELWMRRHLPQAMMFGRKSTGVAFFRGKWGDPVETCASFKAGDLLAHHDHYDCGHFSIQKAGVLTGSTGTYGAGYAGAHRLGWFVQTVAANSLLVLAPGETSADLSRRKEKKWESLSGGQRVIRPTSFSCASMEHFRAQLNDGPHLERADITAFKSVPGLFDYTAADITAAYNSTRYAEPGNKAKVSLVTRQFVYYRPCDAFIVYDRVETAQPEFTPKFLLHTASKPVSATERLVAGNSPEDGILESTDRLFTSELAKSRLVHLVVLPERSRVLKIGGANYCFYVESDGDPNDGFDGVNLSFGEDKKGRSAPRFRNWRIEIEPAAQGRSTRFLNVLFPRLKSDAAPLPAVGRVSTGPETHGLQISDMVFVFAVGARPLTAFSLTLDQPLNCVVFDVPPGSRCEVGGRACVADSEGVLIPGNVPAGEHVIQLAR